MPLPLGHAAVGLAVYELYPNAKPAVSWWKLWLFVAFLTVLPDVDYIAGLLYGGNANIFHRGATHSLIFAVIAGFFAARAGKRWPRIIPPLGFMGCFLTVLSHTMLDMFFAGTNTSLFYPFELAHSAGHADFWDLVETMIKESYEDLGLILACAAIILLARAARKIYGSVKQKRSAPKQP